MFDETCWTSVFEKLKQNSPLSESYRTVFTPEIKFLQIDLQLVSVVLYVVNDSFPFACLTCSMVRIYDSFIKNRRKLDFHTVQLRQFLEIFHFFIHLTHRLIFIGLGDFDEKTILSFYYIFKHVVDSMYQEKRLSN